MKIIINSFFQCGMNPVLPKFLEKILSLEKFTSSLKFKVHISSLVILETITFSMVKVTWTYVIIRNGPLYHSSISYKINR